MKVFLNERIHLGGEDWLPDSSNDFNDNVKNLIETLESFIFLTEATVFYSSIELNKLIENITTVEEFSDYSITNPVHRIRTILSQVESIDWTYSKKQRTDYLYYFISGLGAITHNVNETSIAEACEYKHENNEVVLINILSSQFNETNPLNVLRSNVNPPNNSLSNPLPFISNRTQTVSYYHTHRNPRTYKWNPKHGENGKGMIYNKDEEVSPLECSKVEAAAYLENAVGYRKTNELYNIDKNKFMVWKCDSIEQNSFHSYHPINQDEIEEYVKEFLKQILN
jgi:hypothetical protein